MCIRSYGSRAEALDHVLFWHRVAVFDADKVVYHLPNDLTRSAGPNADAASFFIPAFTAKSCRKNKWPMNFLVLNGCTSCTEDSKLNTSARTADIESHVGQHHVLLPLQPQSDFFNYGTWKVNAYALCIFSRTLILTLHRITRKSSILSAEAAPIGGPPHWET